MPGSVQSVERAAAILRLLAEENEPLGLAQIASALGLAKSTVHGILRTLEAQGALRVEYGGIRVLDMAALRGGVSGIKG